MTTPLLLCQVPGCLILREAGRREGHVLRGIRCGDGTALVVCSNGSYYHRGRQGKLPTSPARYMVWALTPALYAKMLRSSLRELLTYRWSHHYLKGIPLWTPVQLERKLTQLSHLHR